MSERKATNKYYPPEWRPEMGSINYYRKSKKERPKDREPRDPVFTIRFEMPFNIWCNGCNNHVGMGVRYNAHKISIGYYFTTPIYKFRMKCHLCDNHYEIRTDPENNDYVILSGARRKEERWDPKESGAVELMDNRDKKELEANPMFRLEHVSMDKAKAVSLEPTIKSLQDLNEILKDDYSANSALRSNLRKEKQEVKIAKQKDMDFKQKYCLDKSVPLLPENEHDSNAAQLIDFSKVKKSKSFASSVRAAKRSSIFSDIKVSEKLKSKASVDLLKKVLHKR